MSEPTTRINLNVSISHHSLTNSSARGKNKPLIMINNSPPPNLIDTPALSPRRNLITNNLHTMRRLLPQVIHQQSANNGLHPTTQDDNGHVILPSPVKEGLEPLVELDVFYQDINALVKGGVGADAVKHLLEAVAEVALEGEHVDVASLAEFRAEAQVVGEEIVAVLLGDCAVEVCEEDEFGVRFERGEGGGGSHFWVGWVVFVLRMAGCFLGRCNNPMKCKKVYRRCGECVFSRDKKCLVGLRFGCPGFRVGGSPRDGLGRRFAVMVDKISGSYPTPSLDRRRRPLLGARGQVHGSETLARASSNLAL